MVFSSVEFLFVFLPAVFLIYSICPRLRFKNCLLLIASLLFYAYGEPIYIALLLASSLFHYLLGIGITGVKKNATKRLLLTVMVCCNIGVLILFKYAGFLIQSWNLAAKAAVPVPEIAFPIGISFYTFQAMSYVIDVYRDEGKVQKNYGKLLLYISFFPQLVAGPIVKYSDIAFELDHRRQTLDGIMQGIRRFIIGLSKKVLISNVLAISVDRVFSMSGSECSALSAWFAAVAYLMQIYYDFSGYSDMAIGLGWMFGFHFKENFNYPYFAESVKDFWRRWHISLSEWFKEYLYIPLGGNRKGKARTVVNKWIVFFCTGLWHGANWTFVLWGLYHGFLSMLEQTKRWPMKKVRHTIWKHIYLILAVLFGFVLFRADNLSNAGMMFENMLFGWQMTALQRSMAIQLFDPYTVITLMIACIFSMPVLKWVKEHTNDIAWIHGLSYAAAIILYWLCIVRLSSGSYNPFIYFRF